MDGGKYRQTESISPHFTAHATFFWVDSPQSQHVTAQRRNCSYPPAPKKSSRASSVHLPCSCMQTASLPAPLNIFKYLQHSSTHSSTWIRMFVVHFKVYWFMCLTSNGKSRPSSCSHPVSPCFAPLSKRKKTNPISSHIISLCAKSRKPKSGHITESQCLFEYTKRSPVIWYQQMLACLRDFAVGCHPRAPKVWKDDENQIIQGTEGGLTDSPAVRTLEPVGATSPLSGPTQPVCSARLCHNLVHSSLSCQFEDSHEHVCKRWSWENMCR